MTDLATKIEEALTPEKFREWLDGLDRRTEFLAGNCAVCALAQYVNHVAPVEPLSVATTHVFAPDGTLCALPRWARVFVSAHDRKRDTWWIVSLPAVYEALDEAVGA